MAHSKGKEKKVRIKEKAEAKGVVVAKDADAFYSLHPSWNFSTCDQSKWQFDEVHAGYLFWTETLPRLKEWERLTWREILLIDKTHNHAIGITDLQAAAIARLNDMRVEIDSVISMRFTGTHRMYGYIVDGVFNLLWFDTDHGDNDECVCRSKKKHT